MDRLISEQKVFKIIDNLKANFTCYDSVTLDEVASHVKAIPSAEPQNSEDKIIRRTLENFMRGLWEEIKVGELEYTTSEVYEMLEREIFTDNHVDIPNKTGHWIVIDDCEQFIAKCSECGEVVDSRMINKYPYCHCGAKMQAESEE